MRCWILGGYVVLLSVASTAAVPGDEASIGGLQIPLYPGAEWAQETPMGSSTPAATSHALVLGALEKINNELVPERIETFRGIKTTYTWYLPEARRTVEVGIFFEQALSGLGQMLFQCKGRECGSSSSWANKIFNRPILYGPEQHQHYYVLKSTDGSSFLTLYIGQRATRKIYLHIEHIAPVLPGNVVGAKLVSEGRYVFTPSSNDAYPPELAQIIAEALSEEALSEAALSEDALSEEGLSEDGTRFALVLVVHDRLAPGEALAAALSRSQRQAESLATAIQAGTRVHLQARGLGPLAPSAVYGAKRIELVVLR